MVRRTIARQTRIRSVRNTRNPALTLRARYLTRIATANVALHIEPGGVLDAPTGHVARFVADAGQRLAVLDATGGGASAHLVAALLLQRHRNANVGVERNGVERGFAQRATRNARVSGGAIMVDQTDFRGVAAMPGARRSNLMVADVVR